jgi:hypothetical protein
MRYRRAIVATVLPLLLATQACSSDEPREPTVYTPPPVPAPPAASLVVAPGGDDEASGTADAPLRTIDAAAQRAEPGMTILVRTGTYEGDVRTKASGTADERIVYVAESPDTRIVGAGDNVGAWENDGDYVDIVGFDISGENADGLWSKGSHVRLIQNRVHDIPGNCIYTANDDYSLTDIDVLSNVAYKCGEDDLDHAIYISHRRGVVANNIAYDSTGFGIQCWHACDEVTITNNLVFRNEQGGIVIGGANDDNRPVDNSLVANNLVVGNGRDGIREGGDSGPNNRFDNNLLWDNERNRILLSTGRETDTVVADPEFVNYQEDGSGDYHLQPGSPAVDTGTSDLAPPVAIDMTPRPQGRGFDIGPYER